MNSPGPPIPSLYPRMLCLQLYLGPSNRSTFVGCVQARRDGAKFSLIYIRVRGGQWLSGRVLDLRPRGRRFKPDRRHCDVSLSKTH